MRVKREKKRVKKRTGNGHIRIIIIAHNVPLYTNAYTRMVHEWVVNTSKCFLTFHHRRSVTLRSSSKTHFKGPISVTVRFKLNLFIFLMHVNNSPLKPASSSAMNSGKSSVGSSNYKRKCPQINKNYTIFKYF